MMGAFQSFIGGFFLWRDALLASVVVATLCGWLGVYIILKRVVFVSAALPQVSGLGVALAFYIGSFYGSHGHEQSFLLNPWFFAVLFSFIAAGIFSLNIDHRKISGETVIGLGYILSSAMVLEILNSPRIVQEAHEIGDILFGNAVVVETQSLYVVLACAIVVLLVHFLLFKEIVAVLFDSEMAATLGLSVKTINLVFYLSVALGVSIATRTIGALPVFGFMVIPPTASLMLSKSMKGSIALSIFIGVFSALLGYFISFEFSLPTGATMVAVSAIWLLPGLFRLNR
jgi:zinc transport system permease protein